MNVMNTAFVFWVITTPEHIVDFRSLRNHFKAGIGLLSMASPMRLCHSMHYNRPTYASSNQLSSNTNTFDMESWRCFPLQDALTLCSGIRQHRSPRHFKYLPSFRPPLSQRTRKDLLNYSKPKMPCLNCEVIMMRKLCISMTSIDLCRIILGRTDHLGGLHSEPLCS